MILYSIKVSDCSIREYSSRIVTHCSNLLISRHCLVFTITNSTLIIITTTIIVVVDFDFAFAFE